MAGAQQGGVMGKLWKRLSGRFKTASGDANKHAQQLKKALPHLKSTNKQYDAMSDKLDDLHKDYERLQKSIKDQNTGMLAGAAALGMWSRAADKAKQGSAAVGDATEKAGKIFGNLGEILTHITSVNAKLDKVAPATLKKWSTEVLATSHDLAELAGDNDKARAAAFELMEVAQDSILTEKLSKTQRQDAIKQYMSMRSVLERLGVESGKVKEMLHTQLQANEGDINKALAAVKAYADEHLGLREVVGGAQMEDVSKFISEQAESSGLAAANTGEFAKSMNEVFVAAKKAGAGPADILETVEKTREAMVNMYEQDWKSSQLGKKLFGNLKERHDLAQKLGRSTLERKQLEEAMATATKGDFKVAKELIAKMQDIPEIRDKMLKEFTSGLGASKSGLLIESVFGGKKEAFDRAQAVAAAMKDGVATSTGDALEEAVRMAEKRGVFDPVGTTITDIKGSLKSSMLEGASEAGGLMSGIMGDTFSQFLTDPTVLMIGGMVAGKGLLAGGKWGMGKIFKKLGERGSTPATPMFVEDISGGMLGGGSEYGDVDGKRRKKGDKGKSRRRRRGRGRGGRGKLGRFGRLASRAKNAIGGVSGRAAGAASRALPAVAGAGRAGAGIAAKGAGVAAGLAGKAGGAAGALGKGVGAVAGKAGAIGAAITLAMEIPELYDKSMGIIESKTLSTAQKTAQVTGQSFGSVFNAVDSFFLGIPSAASEAMGGVPFEELGNEMATFFDEMVDMNSHDWKVLWKQVSTDAGDAFDSMTDAGADFFGWLLGNSPGGQVDRVPKGFKTAFDAAAKESNKALGAIKPGAAGAIGQFDKTRGRTGGAQVIPMPGAAGNTGNTAGGDAGAGLIGQVTGFTTDGGVVFAIPNFAQAMAQYQQQARRYARRR